MQRNRGHDQVKRDNSENLIKRVCPKCKNDKMWTPRGETSPQYRAKCTKCGHKVGFD